MRIKSNIKAGGQGMQHNHTLSRGLRVKSNVKGGIILQRGDNHNQTIRKG